MYVFSQLLNLKHPQFLYMLKWALKNCRCDNWYSRRKFKRKLQECLISFWSIKFKLPPEFPCICKKPWKIFSAISGKFFPFILFSPPLLHRPVFTNFFHPSWAIGANYRTLQFLDKGGSCIYWPEGLTVWCDQAKLVWSRKFLFLAFSIRVIFKL